MLNTNVLMTGAGTVQTSDLIRHRSPAEMISAELKTGENRIFDGRTLVAELVECDKMTKNSDVHKKLTYYLINTIDDVLKEYKTLHRVYWDKIEFQKYGKKLIYYTEAEKHVNYFIKKLNC